MRKVIYLSVLAILAVAAVYYMVSTTKEERFSSPFGWEGDFAMEDTASIQKIFLADLTGKKVLLERKNEKEWQLNNQHKADANAVNLLLNTLTKLTVKAPLTKTSEPNVLRKIAANHVKVELYQTKSKWSKVLYVGGPTPGHDGSYMVLENAKYGKSKTPFIVEIKGFRGFVTPRFHVETDDWRDKNIVKLEEHDVEWIKLINNDDLEESFEVRKLKKGNRFFWEVYDVDLNKVDNIDTMAVRNFLTGFKNLNCERILHSPDTSAINKLRYSLSIKPQNKTVPTIIKVYVNKHLQDPSGINRYFATVNDSMMVTLQYFALQNVLIQKSSLLN